MELPLSVLYQSEVSPHLVLLARDARVVLNPHP